MADWNENLKMFVKDVLDSQSFDSDNQNNNLKVFAAMVGRHRHSIFKLALALDRGELLVSPDFIDAKDGYVAVTGKARMWKIFE